MMTGENRVEKNVLLSHGGVNTCFRYGCSSPGETN
jgi:hypothetical protein